MNKRKLVRAIAVCIAAISIVVIVTLLSACESVPTPPTYGLEFDGLDDCVALGNATMLGFTFQDFTIEGWLKPGNVTKTMQVFQRHGWNNDGYRLQMESPGKFKFYTFQSGANQVSDSFSNVLTADNWSHVAVVRQGVSVRIFVNGVDKTNNAGSHIDPGYSAGRLSTIGCNATQNAFDGYVSEVRIWNYARTESEINSSMYKELNGSESGLVGYWRLNEGSGTIAHDSTANNNTGTLVGGPVWYTGGS
jgi:hypothetical protein